MPYTRTPLGGRNIWTGQEADNAAAMRFAQAQAAQQALAEMQAQLAREQMAGQERMQGVDIGSRERMQGAGLSAEERMLGTRGQQQLEAIRAGQAPQMAGLDFQKQQYADQATMRQLEQQRAQAEWAAQAPVLQARAALAGKVGGQVGSMDIGGVLGDKSIQEALALGIMGMGDVASARANKQAQAEERQRVALQALLAQVAQMEDPEKRARIMAQLAPAAQAAGVLPQGVPQEAFMPDMSAAPEQELAAAQMQLDLENQEAPWYQQALERVTPESGLDFAKSVALAVPTLGAYQWAQALGMGDTDAELEQQALSRLRAGEATQVGGTRQERLARAYAGMPEEMRKRLSRNETIQRLIRSRTEQAKTVAP